jgi:hypothetical protein
MQDVLCMTSLSSPVACAVPTVGWERLESDLGPISAAFLVTVKFRSSLWDSTVHGLWMMGQPDIRTCTFPGGATVGLQMGTCVLAPSCCLPRQQSSMQTASIPRLLLSPPYRKEEFMPNFEPKSTAPP